MKTNNFAEILSLKKYVILKDENKTDVVLS